MSASAVSKGVALSTGNFRSVANNGSALVADAAVVCKDALTLQGKYVPATPASTIVPTQPSSWTLYAGSTTGGGLTAGQLQGFLYEDPAYGTTIQEWLQAYSAVIVAGAVGTPTTSRVVCRIVSSAPLDWTGGYPVAGAGSTAQMGSFTGTGAALVVPCVGISASASLRLYLLGFAGTAGATAVAVPTWTIQPNASFTITATTGAIYGYEVLNQ